MIEAFRKTNTTGAGPQTDSKWNILIGKITLKSRLGFSSHTRVEQGTEVALQSHVKSHTEIFYNNKIGHLSFPNIEWRLMLFNHLTCLKKTNTKQNKKMQEQSEFK